MLRRLGFLVRADERRHVAAAFGFLMIFVGSHTVLETARDALFLTRIPSTHLPFVYMAIAFVSFVVTRLQLAHSRGGPRREMAIWTAFGGAGSILLGLLLPVLGTEGLYVLYVWPGVVATLTLVHFWSLLGGIFTATQAKRLFGIVSLGSMIGALTGSGGMTIALRYSSPQALVVVSGVVLTTASLMPLFLFRGVPGSTSPRVEPRGPGLAGYAYILRGPYPRRLVSIALFASATLTFADYVFKTTIADSLPKEQLPQALGAIYTGLNALSLLVQLAGVGFVLRKLAPPVILAVLPALLVLSGGGVAITGILAAALAVKATDGALRHSLHKTAMELLVVPLSDSVRRTVKSAMEVAGQRGGQVVASAVILLAEATGLGGTIAWVLTASALAWAASSVRLRALYVEQFRGPVVDSRALARHVHAPKLDVASLETLIAALDSESNDEVLAALGILERERKSRLVPTLILYHPDEEVVVAALRLFSRTRRTGALHAIDSSLTKHESVRVRAEAYAARAAIEPDATFLKRAYAEETSCEGRAAIAAVLATEQTDDVDEGRRMLEEVLEDASPSTQVVICEVLGWRRAVQFADVLETLAASPELEVRKSAIHSLGDLASTRAATALVDLLGEEPVQRSARQALSRTGDVGFGALEAALRDRDRPSSVRWAVPRAMALLDPERAASALLANLRVEPDGMVRFRSIVTLGNILEQHPKLRLDRKLLDQEIRNNVSRAYRYLDRRLVLEAGAREEASRKKPGHELLVDLLRDKQRSAIGRIFRLLSLAFPQHRFVDIYLAIEGGERGFRANAVELTHNLLKSPLREAVVGLVDEIDDEARLALSEGYHEPIERSYEGLLRSLLRSSSAIVRDIAAFHVAELGLADMIEDLGSLAGEGKGSADVDRALDILGGRPPGSVGVAIPIDAEPARAG
jgi:ATP:ADP antiporter, AAA family